MMPDRRIPGLCTYCDAPLPALYRYADVEVPEAIPGQTIERFDGRHFLARGGERTFVGEGYAGLGSFCTKRCGWRYALAVVRAIKTSGANR